MDCPRNLAKSVTVEWAAPFITEQQKPGRHTFKETARERRYAEIKRRRCSIYVSSVTALFNLLPNSRVSHCCILSVSHCLFCQNPLASLSYYCWRSCLSEMARSGLALTLSSLLWPFGNNHIHAHNLRASPPCIFVLISLTGSVSGLMLKLLTDRN